MALTFTLVSQLKESVTLVIEKRIQHAMALEREKERLALEAEASRTRGTQVTEASFRAWRDKFNKEALLLKEKEEEDRIKGLNSKERDEHRKMATRLTGEFLLDLSSKSTNDQIGRQLFEKNKNLDDSDVALIEDGVVSVDFSQFDRAEAQSQAEDEERVQFSDSDG
jgi:hypothetical protein